MKGKVNCTCGWSWNKSDSSVKDMYICHQCGRDNSNNMKNGGWMDNYNDSKASAPEGMVGDGFSNVGRNYSPAWGGQFEEGGEIPKAQFGLPIAGAIADKIASWFSDDDKPAKKPVKKYTKGKPRTLSITDPRKKMATTNKPLRPNSDLVSGKYDSRHLDKLMQEAKRQGLSKQDMMNLSAMGFQETKWGRTDPNIGHTLGKWEGDNQYRRFISAYKAKMKEADRLGITDPAMRLQVYNGMGTVTPKTEKDYHGFEMQKIYGVPIPKGGISMKKNPLYGKQVMDIRDNVLAKNPEYMRYMDSIYKAPVSMYVNAEDEKRQMFATNPSLHLLIPERVVPPQTRFEMSGSRRQQGRQDKLIDNGPSGASGSFPRTQAFAPMLAPIKKNAMGGSIPQAQDGKLVFLQPNSEKLPKAYRIPYADPSSELAMSIGGENGEPAYLIPSFKYGHPLDNPIEEFKRTGEHLGGPFKTWQEADQWEQEVRHPYVEKGQAIPTPIKTWGEMATGGSIPGSPGFTYARTIDPAPSEGPYAKKTMASAQDGFTTKDKPKLGAGKYYTTTGKVVDWGTPEYERAYNRGEVLSEDGVRSEVTLEGGVLPELVLQNNYKNGFWENYRDKIIEEGKDSGVLGATLGVPINAVFSLPQLAMMNAVTGKVQRPSEAWGFENNEGWFANPTSFGKHLTNLGLDVVTDPASWVGVSELTAPGRLTKAQALERLSNLKNIKAGNLFGKQKSKGPNYRLITDEDLSLSDFNKASKQQIKSIGEKNVYKDIAKSESKRHQDLLRDIEEYGEGWKYLDEDIANSAKRAADAKAEWTNYLDAQEANIKANPEYFNNTADDLVYYKGKGLGKQELEQLAKEQVDQWYAIQEYKGIRPNTKGYISDVEDYMGDPKYMLPGNRFNREAMLRDMGEDAMSSFNKLYKNQNWKPNIGDIPLNKQGGVIKSDRGQWDYPGQITEIDQSKKGSYIDMGPDPKTGKPITQNILAVSDTGDVRLMRPGGKYKLEGKKVVEYPIAQDGTKTKGKLNPELQAALDKFKAGLPSIQPKSNKVNTREVFTATNDNIPNASKMAAKADEARAKDVRHSNRIAAEKAQAQRTAQRQFNALPKEEQERILYEQYAQQHGTITQAEEPDSKLSKFAQSLVLPMTALKDLYHTGQVRDDLIRSVWNNPTATENNPLDAAYLGTLGYIAAPFIQSGVTALGSTVAPYMAADAVVPYTGATLTGVNLNNLLTAGFATHGAMHMGPDVAKFADKPSWENLGNIAWDVAEVAPVVGPAAKTIGEGFGYFGKGFGYLGDKGRQAITAVKESTPYVALNKSAETKLVQRLDEIRDARMQLQYGPHNQQVDDALNKLADEEWKIIHQLDKRTPYANAADRAYINIKSRQIDKANQFTLNNEGLYQSKVDHPLGFKQGSSQIIDLETGEMFPISVKGSGVEAVQKMDNQGNVIKTVTNTSEPIMNEDYIRVLNRNIDYIEKNVPGAKVYGSTRTAGELGVPHVTGEMANGKPFFEVGDYDVYMTQSNYEKHFGKKPGIDYSKPQNHAGPGEHGKDLQMQVNVIAENSQGKAIGEKALELFRQWEPDEFFKAAKEAMKKGKDAKIEIPYTSEQLIEKVNPTVKTVMDAYEAWKNEKNINKIDGIINYGNPDIVLEGQKQFVKGLLGSRGNVGHQFDVSQFADVNENLKILKDINFIGNPTRVAKDPKRMQIAINDFYINNSILSRQVKDIPLDDLATYESALGVYNPNASGMSFNGIGQNNTLLGNVGHYNPSFGSAMPRDYVTGVKQYGLNLDVSNPRAYIESIKHTTSGSKLFTQEEKDILYEIVQKYKGKIDGYSPERSDTTTQLVHNLPKSEEAKALMYEFAKKTNRRLNVQEGNTYVGGSTYVSALDDFDEALDVMTYTYGEQYNFDNALKSFQQRLNQSKMTSSQQINALSDELLPREFKQIEGYLKGGMDKAKERVQQLRDELAKLNVQKQDFARRAANRKLGGLRTQIEAKEKAFRDEIRILTDNEREIQKRLDQVAKFKSHSKMVAKNFLIGSGVAGTGVVGGKLATLKADQVRDDAKEEETKLKEKFKKLTPDQQNKAQYDYERELIRLQQIQESPFTGGILGSTVRETNNPLLKVDQNGGRINRAIDRTQLVKLNQLTNFTNYNKPQPGGWLSKYE